MVKTVLVGTAVLFVTASPIALAQTPPSPVPLEQRLSPVDQNSLTDMRVDLVKAALQLTPEQEKLWPPVESAIRSNAEDRRGRIAKIQETVGIRSDQNQSRADVMRNRDPIAFLQRRSQALAQRSADLDKLAEAWQPLYNTLTQEQRKRMAAVAVFVLRDMSDAADRRRARSEDNED